MSSEEKPRYRIERHLGQRGRCDVWLACDLEEDRQVDLVYLPAREVPPERMERLDSRARALDGLEHRGIAAIHGLREHGERPCVVVDHAPGMSLADALAGGPLLVTEGLLVSLRLADALAAAHERKVCHGCLTPEDVTVSSDGHVTLFGFEAELLDEPGAGGDPYRSPERRRGEPPQPHDDVWAFGCLLFEILTGERPFGGASPRAPQAREGEPNVDEPPAAERGPPPHPDLHRVPDGVPLAARALIRRLLAPDPHRRLTDLSIVHARLVEALRDLPQADDSPFDPREEFGRMHLDEGAATAAGKGTAGGGRLILDEDEDADDPQWDETRENGAGDALAKPPGPRSKRPARSRLRARPVRLVAAVVLLGGILVLVRFGPHVLREGEPEHERSQDPPALPRTGELPRSFRVPAQAPTGGLTISRDGRFIVLAATDRSRATSLVVHDLEGGGTTPIRGTEGATQPRLSPDGSSVAFVAGNEVRRAPLDAGSATTIVEAPGARGIAWSEGFLVVGTAHGLVRVSEDDGATAPLTTSRAGSRHAWPEGLPGGERMLFTHWRGSIAGSSIESVRVEDGARRTIVDSASYPRYAEGRLFYVTAKGVVAAKFDARSPALTGEPVPLQDVAISPATGRAAIAIGGGRLVLLPASGSRTTVVRLDRDGRGRPLGDLRGLQDLRVSISGRRIVATHRQGSRTDVVVYRPERDRWDRLTRDGASRAPVWMSDGSRIAYASSVGTGRAIVTRELNEHEAAGVLVEGRGDVAPCDAHGGIDRLAYADEEPDRSTVAVITAGEGGSPLVVQTSPTDPACARFSPDGRFLAVASMESGTAEIYVQPHPPGGERRRVSKQGGIAAAWSRGGSELLYHDGFTVYAVPIVSNDRAAGLDALVPGPPEALFEGRFAPSLDVDARGRILLVREGDHRLVVRPLPDID